MYCFNSYKAVRFWWIFMIVPTAEYAYFIQLVWTQGAMQGQIKTGQLYVFILCRDEEDMPYC